LSLTKRVFCNKRSSLFSAPNVPLSACCFSIFWLRFPGSVGAKRLDSCYQSKSVEILSNHRKEERPRISIGHRLWRKVVVSQAPIVLYDENTFRFLLIFLQGGMRCH
jgi:hypothetical protein